MVEFHVGHALLENESEGEVLEALIVAQTKSGLLVWVDENQWVYGVASQEQLANQFTIVEDFAGMPELVSESLRALKKMLSDVDSELTLEEYLKNDGRIG